MKTSKFQLVVRGAAAAAIALAGSFSSVPALAEAAAGPTPSPTASATPTASASPVAPDPAPAAPAVSDAGLAEAIRRDLGMTLEEFDAAGEQAKRAADAVPSLRVLPGYGGITLKGGKIVVTGSGTELQARVDQLNQANPADFVLVPPAAAPSAPSAPAASAVPSAAASAAPTAAELVASSTEQLFQAYVRDVGPAGLQAVAYADGHFVIRTGGINRAETGLPAVLDPRHPPTPAAAPPTPPAAATPTLPGKISPAEFVARYANVHLEKGDPIKTEEDLYGGQGYVIDQMAICSAGFGAFSPAGLPEVLTAGHCAGDGPAKKAADLEPPTASTAGGAITPLARPLAPLGTFGFSQFGGLNNSWITGTEASPGNVGTDIAVIELLRSGVNIQPAATKWDNVATPGATAVKIIGMVSPFQGQAVCRSGRTTGWSCGTVNELGIYVVGGATTNVADLRAFRGFLSYDVQSSGGDSGGPWVSGNYAVGTHSAGDAAGSAQNFAIATTLEDSITHIPGGVQLQLFLNKPELAAPANGTPVTAGEPITGRVLAAPASAVAANSKVRITVGTQKLDVPVDSTGNWSFRAPLPAGPLTFTAETVNGFSHSGAETFTVDVAPSALPVPGMTTPTDASLPAVGSIDGTGMPGAVVTLSGDVSGTGTVALDGHWAVPVDGRAAFGKVTVTATLSSPGIADSPSATGTFTVIPPAPGETTIPDGLHFNQDALPSTISGNGVEGAEVTVLIDGVPARVTQPGGGAGVGARAVVRALMPQVLVAGGRWSLPFPAGLALGPHRLTVTQSVDGVESAPLDSTFTIDPAAVHPADAPPATAHPAGDTGSGSGQLPNTGAGALQPAAGLAAGALALGAALLLLGRRRVRS
ncbi:trypsin-like serine protease [Arthrobacter sp. PAMC25564]|uniref:S1 family peptidase n=1 Tax=Arthrobacter sp. PAMC25564 TaxID=2565366 RepID=UPI0010A22D79|nr:S1 family peptidase [Arthrobacter sp. PAMC25564]QCB96522.1 trypsin-like serine protease [Arthrobacter sp. PAMC25564]